VTNEQYVTVGTGLTRGGARKTQSATTSQARIACTKCGTACRSHTTGLCKACFLALPESQRPSRYHATSAKAPSQPVEAPRTTEWHAQSACNDPDVDPEMFFHPENETGSPKAQRIEEAVAICETCPVLQLCRADALARKEEYGIRGGLSEDERAVILAGGSVPTARLHREPVVIPAGGRTVDPAPVAEHVNELLAAGFSATSISRFAGVAIETVRGVTSGTRKEIYRHTAQKLLSVQMHKAAA